MTMSFEDRVRPTVDRAVAPLIQQVPTDAAARHTARLLVSDIRLLHDPAVNEGRRHRNLLTRLAPEIEKARQAYNEQVPAGVRDHTEYFHQELIKTLAGGDASRLGDPI